MSAFSRATASVAGFKKSKYTKTKNTQNLLQFFGNGQTTAALFNLRVIYFIQSSASMKLIKRILNSRSLFLPFKDQNRQHALFVRLLNAMHSFLSKFFGKCISLQTNSDEHSSNKVKEKERERPPEMCQILGKLWNFIWIHQTVPFCCFMFSDFVLHLLLSLAVAFRYIHIHFGRSVCVCVIWKESKTERWFQITILINERNGKKLRRNIFV